MSSDVLGDEELDGELLGIFVCGDDGVALYLHILIDSLRIAFLVCLLEEKKSKSISPFFLFFNPSMTCYDGFAAKVLSLRPTCNVFSSKSQTSQILVTTHLPSLRRFKPT